MHFTVLRIAAALGVALALSTSSALPTLASTTASGALFLNKSSSTDSPSLRVDSNGGMHLAFAGYYTGINPGDDPNQPGYYAYCAPNADCSQPANWVQVALGSHVQAAQLQLTPGGQPRILFEVANGIGGGATSSYWYAACDAGCTDPAGWSMLDIADTSFIDATIWDQTKHSFALDGQGRPRFVYGSGTFVYATCDAACTDVSTDPSSGQTVPANWLYTVLSDNLYVNEPSLTFTSSGLPRLTAYVYNPSDFSFNVDYLECNAGCGDSSQWTLTTLMPEGQSPLGMSLRLDATDRVALALSQSNQLWYWQCGGGCSDPNSWIWTRFDGLNGNVSDADLAFDGQNQPHLGVRSTGGPFGWGLVHMSCNADCTTPNASWTANQVEDSNRLGQDLSLPLPANCLTGGWMGDFRPSIALDAAGNASFAFDNQFWVSGCSDRAGVSTEFEAVRVVYSAQPVAAFMATASSAAARTVLHSTIATSHGRGSTSRHINPVRLPSGQHASHRRPHVSAPAHSAILPAHH